MYTDTTYEAPSARVIDLDYPGVLCASDTGNGGNLTDSLWDQDLTGIGDMLII